MSIEDRKNAGPKAPAFTYRGVRIESRWDVARELEIMRRLVDALELNARRLVSVWCDSEAGSTYTVEVPPDRWEPELKWVIADAFTAAGIEHNLVVIQSGGLNRCTIAPNWYEGDSDD